MTREAAPLSLRNLKLLYVRKIPNFHHALLVCSLCGF
jgi:hypothetical protein